MTSLPVAPATVPARAAALTRAGRALVRSPRAVIAVAYLAIVTVAAIAAPVLAPYSPAATDLGHVLSGPSLSHPMGTDNLGRDVLSRLMYGGRVSLSGVVVAVATMLVLGVVAGLLAGFLRGWVDRGISWLVDLMLAIPVISTLLVVLSVVGSNETAAMITVGVLAAPALSRVVRGATLAVQQETYVSAARVTGLPDSRIIAGQVLPRVTGPVIVQAAIGAGGALMAQTGIEFLGLGVPPPTPTWGGLVTDASQVVDRQPWLLVPSGLVIALTVLAFGLLGDAVRDATADQARRPAPRTRDRARQPEPAAPPGEHGAGTSSGTSTGTGTGTSTALLSLRDVTIALPASDGLCAVVENVSVDIRAGETIGLVGESGCGKSMTGRAVLGMLPPGGQITRGGIYFEGTNLATLPRGAWGAIRGSRIAFVSQEPVGSLDPMFTVGHQVDELVRRHHGGSRQQVRKRTLELLSSVRLRDVTAVASRYPHELSGGMAQRVAIAMALAGDPRLLIADEPTTALDVTIQAEILELLGQLQAERGMAILLISHDLGVISHLCQRAYVMYAGQSVESGPVTELFSRPRHPYTAALVGSNPRRTAPRTRLRTRPGVVPSPGQWPAGCRFQPRCPLATADCSAGPIPVAEPAAGHRTRCLRHADVAKEGDNVSAGTPA